MTLSYTYGKLNKLKKSKVITALYESGSKWYTPSMRLHYAYVDQSLHDSSLWRSTVIVPKRLVRQAVNRIRCKRLMREALRLSQHDIPIQEGKTIQFLLVLRANVSYITVDSLRKELKTAYHRIAREEGL